MLRGSTLGPAEVKGYQRSPGEDVEVQIMHVTPEFFDTLGLSLLAGRKFTAQDNESAPKVAIVNQTMARYFFRDSSPLGRVSRQAEIVGVVNDTKFASLREPAQRILYLPEAQAGSHQTTQTVLAIRTNGQAAANLNNIITTIRAELNFLAKGMTDVTFTTLEREIGGSILRERLAAQVSSCFGGLALLLVSIGLYGLLSYNVNRRASEIGIRLALGAQRSNIIRLVVQETLLLTLAGLALGLAAAWVITRLISGLLFGLPAHDPVTFAAAASLLALVALLACYLPARRATRVDPMVALRYE
jgi:predicted permease